MRQAEGHCVEGQMLLSPPARLQPPFHRHDPSLSPHRLTQSHCRKSVEQLADLSSSPPVYIIFRKKRDLLSKDVLVGSDDDIDDDDDVTRKVLFHDGNDVDQHAEDEASPQAEDSSRTAAALLEAKVDGARARRKAQLQARRDALQQHDAFISHALATVKTTEDVRRENMRQQIAERQRAARERREHMLDQRRMHRPSRSRHLQKRDVATGSDSTDLDLEPAFSGAVVPPPGDDERALRDVILRGPQLLQQLAECGLSESATDYSSSDDVTGDAFPRGSANAQLADDANFTHHLHLAPRRVLSVLQRDLFAPCAMCRKKTPATALCAADPAQRHKPRLSVLAAKLLPMLLLPSMQTKNAPRAAGVGHNELLSAFLAAAQYRDDSFNLGRAALDTLASPLERHPPSLRSLVNISRGSGGGMEEAADGPSLVLAVERLVNLEAARLVNVLYFVHDRLSLAKAMSSETKLYPFDLSEQLARFATAWTRYSAAVTFTQSQEYKNASTELEQRQHAAMQAALHTLRRTFSDRELSRRSNDETKGPRMSLQKLKAADLLEGVESQLAAMLTSRQMI